MYVWSYIYCMHSFFFWKITYWHLINDTDKFDWTMRTKPFPQNARYEFIVGNLCLLKLARFGSLTISILLYFYPFELGGFFFCFLFYWKEKVFFFVVLWLREMSKIQSNTRNKFTHGSMCFWFVFFFISNFECVYSSQALFFSCFLDNSNI